VHLVDGTYELFRQHFGSKNRGGSEATGPYEATIGVLTSTLQLIEDGATHVGVASDHVIESFRNDLWAGYKTSEGMLPELLEQIPLMEEGSSPWASPPGRWSSGRPTTRSGPPPTWPTATSGSSRC
jgi:hypothetical protein